MLKTDSEKAYAAAERIRNDIVKDAILYNNKEKVFVSVTIGLSSFNENHTIKDMMEDADQKLYYGKNNGKNQVVISL